MTIADFSSMLLTHKEAMSYYAYLLTKDGNDAKDLVQETIIRALVKKDKFTQGSNLKAWLRTMMRNIFINNYRRNKAHHVTAKSFYDEPTGAYTGTVNNEGLSSLRVREVKQKVNELPDIYRTPLEMYYRGFPYKEISEILEQPLGTIKSRIHLAKKSLSTSLQN
jgi:RNA polymerase sigma-70 factor (ECF subfamily)